MANTFENHLHEARVLLNDGAAGLSAITMLLCDYQDGIQLPADGLRVLLLSVQDHVEQGLELVRTMEAQSKAA